MTLSAITPKPTHRFMPARLFVARSVETMPAFENADPALTSRAPSCRFLNQRFFWVSFVLGGCYWLGTETRLTPSCLGDVSLAAEKNQGSAVTTSVERAELLDMLLSMEGINNSESAGPLFQDFIVRDESDFRLPGF